MPKDEKKKAYDDAYLLEHYDRICFRVKKGAAAVWRARADARGESLTAYICRLIAEDIARDAENAATGEPETVTDGGTGRR